MFATSPNGIHALPVELLTRVFVLGAQDDHPYKLSPFLLKPDQNYYAVPSTLFQLTASHVCHHWRHVALRSPALWTTLYFREQSHIPRATAFLGRCARSPSRRLDILVDTVASQDHVPGVTLCRDELTSIFDLICPHVPFWRAFHLIIRDDTCKQIARKYLGNAPPAPNLQTLQLYHFEDFRAVQDLYIATYRPPVRIFSNSLPQLKNVSLIGVNLPWDASPYLHNLHVLELALHSDHTRPPYVYWDRMLRFSPHLQRLLLTYSGPRAENGTEDLAWTTHDYSCFDSYDSSPSSTPPHSPYATEATRKRNAQGKAKQDDSYNEDNSLVLLESLWELSLTDLDPDYLCRVLQRLVMPNVNKLSLDLPDQDFTPFVELIAPSPPLLLLHEQHAHERALAGNDDDAGNIHCSDATLSHDVGAVAAQLPSGDDDVRQELASSSGSSSLSEEQERKFPLSPASSSAQTPTFHTIPPPPSSATHTIILADASSATSFPASSSASLSSIKPVLSSISPSIGSSSGSNMVSASRNVNDVNTSSISVNSLTSFGSTLTPPSSHSTSSQSLLPGHAALHSTSSLHSIPSGLASPSYHSSSTSAVSVTTTTTTMNSFIQVNVNKRRPLPRISTTLHTLIITALDCEYNAWRGFFAALEGLQVLEVNFYKVQLTRSRGQSMGEKSGGAAYRVLLDRVSVQDDSVHGFGLARRGGRTRMVMPMLRRCKVAGLSGMIVKQLIEGRMRGEEEVGQGARVEWQVVEGKYMQGDRVLSEVFERGVWVATGTRNGEEGRGRWVKVQKVVEDEEEEEEEEEGEADDGDSESEVEGEEEEMNGDGDEGEAEGVDELEGHGAERGEEQEADDEDDGEEEEEISTPAAARGAHEYICYLDTQTTAAVNTNNCAKIRGSRASSVGGSNTSDSATGFSDSAASESSSGSEISVGFGSSLGTSVGVWRGSTRRSDSHRGME
ncbi:hypothetical protein D9756_004871 [Leucocoprinus leucothites]|uniref:F-box domain-containing protein n=1 Tax=Leucocoprinus leucothites TaxID=201217 RepID=A0A8H5GA29_9AGAR|nr:hypothetical protein D9756_004871 [Leucoagaricus leucothites]